MTSLVHRFDGRGARVLATEMARRTACLEPSQLGRFISGCMPVQF